MITFSNKDSIYIGREAGKEILSRIKSAKSSVKIVSPYLSPDYVKELLHLHKKGRKITLIACDKIGENSFSDFRVADLLEKEKIANLCAKKFKKTLLNSSILLFALSILLVMPAFALPTLFIFAGMFLFAGIAAFIASVSLSDYSEKYLPIFRIKVFDSASGKNPGSTELIHSKIFVIDEEVAFLGSINFTYSGFKTHYETAIKVEDKKAVHDISQEVEALYHSQALRAKSPAEWGGGG